MARLLVIQHAVVEGAGRWAALLPDAGLDIHPIHPYLGHRVPASVEGDALLVLGGSTSAYDDTAAPWLPEVRALLATAVEDGVPTLGICLGAQLLAVAGDGAVSVPGAAGPEFGAGEVDVTATDDPLLPPGRHAVMQWHHDAVTTLPPGAVSLASSALYAHQAFRLGDAAWGLQFHPETTVDQVAGWAVEAEAEVRRNGSSVESVIDGLRRIENAAHAVGDEVGRRFAALVTG